MWKVYIVALLNVELEKIYSSLEMLVRDHSNLLFFVKTLYQLDVTIAFADQIPGNDRLAHERTLLELRCGPDMHASDLGSDEPQPGDRSLREIRFICRSDDLGNVMDTFHLCCSLRSSIQLKSVCQ